MRFDLRSGVCAAIDRQVRAVDVRRIRSGDERYQCCDIHGMAISETQKQDDDVTAPQQKFRCRTAWRLHANSIIFVFQDKAGRTSVSGCNREAGGGIQEIGIRGRAEGL